MNISKKSKPVIVLRYHSEVRQEAVQQALAAMNDKPKQVGRQDDIDAIGRERHIRGYWCGWMIYTRYDENDIYEDAGMTG